MNARQRIEDEYDCELTFADGFDAAIIGICTGWFGDEGGVIQRQAVVYDLDRCIRILVEQGMDAEDAEEFLDFNTLGAYVGRSTPVFMRKI